MEERKRGREKREGLVFGGKQKRNKNGKKKGKEG